MVIGYRTKPLNYKTAVKQAEAWHERTGQPCFVYQHPDYCGYDWCRESDYFYGSHQWVSEQDIVYSTIEGEYH